MAYNIDFNISYSLLSVWYRSPLQFYFQFIKKNKPDTRTPQVYGLAGNIVHNAMEKYINDGTDPVVDVHKEWILQNIANIEGFPTRFLKLEDYVEMTKRAKYIVDDLCEKGYTFKTELLIKRKLGKHTLKGYIDVVAYKDDEVVIVDWKTNSSVDLDHKKQQLFYNYLYFKEFGKIPKKFTWYYLKLNKTLEQKNLGMFEIQNQEKDIKEFIETIESYGEDVDKYTPGDINNPFNEFKGACEKVLFERMSRPSLQYEITIQGIKCSLTGDVNEQIHAALTRLMTYREKDAIFKIRKLKEKYIMQYIHQHGHNSHEDAKKYADERTKNIGLHCLYSQSSQSFPIGMLERVRKVLNDYGQYTKKNINIIENKTTYSGELLPIPNLTTDKVLRPYQQEAINVFLNKKIGVLELCTGAGKTFILANIVSEVKKRTLILIDRIELLDQLHETFTKFFQCDIGRIGDGICELQDITIGTVQTLSRDDISSEVKLWMHDVEFIAVDEFHKAATESFYKVFYKLPHIQYRLGLTGTAFRNDGKELALFGLIGDIIMQVSARELITMGYLMKPIITFFNVPISQTGADYAKDYDASIIQNQWRNAKIKQLVENNRDKKILILTKLVQKHGKVLYEYIGECEHITSQTQRDKRKQILKDFKSQESGVLISTTQIASTGLDIEDLDIIINASANSSEITSIQSLGRVLRTSKGKEFAYYYDFLDAGTFTEKCSRKRIKQFKDEGHEVKVE